MADDSKATEAPAAKGGSKLVPILLGVNLLLVAGVLALFLTRGGPGGHAEAKPAAATPGEHGAAAPGAPGPTAKMADFVVHLRDAEVDRYARISFEVELAGEVDKAAFERFAPRVRDGFISYLSDRTLEDLRGGDQVRKVKAALQDLLKELAPGVAVRALYVTDLVIQ